MVVKIVLGALKLNQCDSPFSVFRWSFSYSVLMFSLIHQGAWKAYDQQF